MCTFTFPFLLHLPQGLTKHDIINGGLEVILYDHHKFASDSNIGGLRICLPKKRVQHELIRNDSSDSSSFGSRGASPVPAELSPNGKATCIICLCSFLVLRVNVLLPVDVNIHFPTSNLEMKSVQ